MIYKKVHNHLVLNFGEKTENDSFLYMYVSIAYFFFLSESCCCALRSNIFAKTKKFAKPFLPVRLGPRSNLLRSKNGRKSRDTVPLSVT